MSAAPGAARLLGVWLKLGVLSFGGGAATLALIRRTAVDEQKWLTEVEFSRFWALVQLVPGINQLALTILIGRHVAGAAGIALSLLGLLLPSVGITLLLTAGYAHVQHDPWIQAALRGIIPAVVGLGGVTAWQIAVPPLRRSRQAGRSSFVLSLSLLLGSALIAWRSHWPVLAVLLGAASVNAAWHWQQHRRADTAP